MAYQSHTICFCIVITGTGKTLAYLAPLVHHLREDERTHGVITRPKRPRACIVVPGRELGVQVLVSDISVFVERGFVTSLIYRVRMGLEILESLEILSFSRTETSWKMSDFLAGSGKSWNSVNLSKNENDMKKELS